MKPRTLVASLSLLALGSACASSNPFLENRMVLEQVVFQQDACEYEQAVRALEKMLADTQDEAGDFALQRFFAAYLLTRLHETASSEAPFLQEPAGEQFSLRSSRGPDDRPSRIGHLMAIAYHSSFGRSWYGSAKNAPSVVDGERLLPSELDGFGARNALAYLNLCFLAVHSELNFQDRIEEILYGSSELTDLDGCEALMDAVELQPAIRPWVYRAVFEQQKRRNEPNAYRFGIRARETGKDVEAFGEELRVEIVDWITNESSYRFVSPANQPFDPALEGCTVTGTPNLMYEAILKNP